mmetsp:Transcript_47346/g.93134  ORF Transcript_47346/g.93134 Transcript_47346/m.93134 type:complete len:89 (-) Transcript_47346:994-1260(-)
MRQHLTLPRIPSSSFVYCPVRLNFNRKQEKTKSDSVTGLERARKLENFFPVIFNNNIILNLKAAATFDAMNSTQLPALWQLWFTKDCF